MCETKKPIQQSWQNKLATSARDSLRELLNENTQIKRDGEYVETLTDLTLDTNDEYYERTGQTSTHSSSSAHLNQYYQNRFHPRDKIKVKITITVTEL